MSAFLHSVMIQEKRVMLSRNEATISPTFQRLSIPRFSWIITEWRKALIVSHGSRLAFSTGSHAQYPPQPSSTYAHHMPRVMPQERNSQESRVHLRMAGIQPVSSRLGESAAI